MTGLSDGYVMCDCGEFAHVFFQCVMDRLPKGYSGELCPRCCMWMCRADNLGQKAEDAA